MWSKAGKGGPGKTVQKYGAEIAVNGGRVFLTFYDDEENGTDGLASAFSGAATKSAPKKLSAKAKKAALVRKQIEELQAELEE